MSDALPEDIRITTHRARGNLTHLQIHLRTEQRPRKRTQIHSSQSYFFHLKCCSVSVGIVAHLSANRNYTNTIQSTKKV